MVNSVISTTNPSYSTQSHDFTSAQDTMELLSAKINFTDGIFIEDISNILSTNHNSKHSVREVSKLCSEKFKKLGIENYQFREKTMF